jgi:hypothetical protein
MPCFHLDAHADLSAHFPGSWIGHSSDGDSPLLSWPPGSPDLTPCGFFLWGYIKDHVYVPPMPCALPQLQQRIVEVVTAMNSEILQCVWQELTSAASPWVDISSTCKVGQKLGVSPS